MEYNQDLTQRHLINAYHYNQLQIGPQIRRRDSYERLMNHSPNQEQFACQAEEEQEAIASEVETDCFPQFLSFIGKCCTPFRIACPCLFCSCCICKKDPLFEQPTGSLGLLQEWGQFKGYLQPGLNVINPLSQSVLEVNLQTQVTEYNQEGMSKDNVHLRLGVAVIYRVANSYKFTYRLAFSPENCIAEMASANLRSLLGRHMLQQIIENQSAISELLRDELNSQLGYWGLYVETCLLKELLIDEQISRALESVIIERRNIEAMLIDFSADVEAGKLIRQVSRIINNEASFQIRYLNAIQNIINNGCEHVIILSTNKPFFNTS